MRAKYLTSCGKEIEVSGYSSRLDVYFIDAIVKQYVAKVHDRVPTHILVNVTTFQKQIGTYGAGDLGIIYKKHMRVITSAGMLKVKITPVNSRFGEIMVGTKEDYERYLVDEVFEKEVLDD